MTQSILLVLLANVLLFATGLGALPLIGVARSGRELLRRSGLAYLVGLAVGGIVAATLAVLQLPASWLAFSLLAGASVVGGAYRLRGRWSGGDRGPRCARIDLGIAAAASVAMLALVVQAGRAFVVAPFYDWDAWAVWGAKGRDLVLFGGADPAVWGHQWGVGHREYPLLVPGLEAMVFRAVGSFDVQVVHLQFLLFAPALVAALVALLGDIVPWRILFPILLALVAAPGFLLELMRAYADVPLACFLAAGTAAAGRWLLRGERWCLVTTALLYGAALVTKNEGTLFVAAAYIAVAFCVGRDRKRLGQVGVAILGSVAILLPWRIYASILHLQNEDYKLGDSFRLGYVASRVGRGPIALHDMVDKVVLPSQWGLLATVALLAAGAALLARRRMLPAFAAAFALLSLAGLSWIYVISPLGIGDYVNSTTARVTGSLVLSLAALAPLMATEARRPEES